MRYPSRHELPDDKERALERAKRLEYWTIAYLISAIVFLYFTLGQSQAMKGAWIEDILSLFPPIAFLIANRFRNREATDRFPYGYHRAVSLAYLFSAVAILLLGSYLGIDSVFKLLKGEHPPIGLVELGDGQIWLGWLMLVALAWSAIPAVILGRLKQPVAAELHDKVLYADSKMNKADWMTACAGMVGVVGIGLGLWWLDAVAAIAIALDIVHDGFRYVRKSMADLADSEPTTYDESEVHPINAKLREALMRCDWVDEALIRLREEGHVFGGEAWVVPNTETALVEKIEAAHKDLLALDWRLHELAIMPVRSLEAVPPDEQVVRHGDSDG